MGDAEAAKSSELSALYIVLLAAANFNSNKTVTATDLVRASRVSNRVFSKRMKFLMETNTSLQTKLHDKFKSVSSKLPKKIQQYSKKYKLTFKKNRIGVCHASKKIKWFKPKCQAKADHIAAWCSFKNLSRLLGQNNFKKLAKVDSFQSQKKSVLHLKKKLLELDQIKLN